MNAQIESNKRFLTGLFADPFRGHGLIVRHQPVEAERERGRLRELQRLLGRHGVGLSLLDQAFAAGVVSRYLAAKQRQAL